MLASRHIMAQTTDWVVLCLQIPILRRTSSLGIKHVLSVNAIRELVIFSSVSYLYMCTGLYTLRHVLAVALASLP